MDRSSSSVSSHHYAALLQTVGELRTDLEKTTNKIATLEDQNAKINQSYNAIKDELFETRRKYNEARESYMTTVAEKFDAERQNEVFLEKLRAQLSEKTREFELIREKLIPHDIDQLRIQVQEELYLQHKQELKAKESDLEVLRDKFHAVKRELERSKGDFSLQIQHLVAENHALRQEKDELLATSAIVATDPQHMAGLQTLLSGFSGREERSKITELTHMVERLRQEITAERQAKDAAVESFEIAESKTELGISSLRSRIASLEAERVAMQERVTQQQAEMERRDGQLRVLRQQREDEATRLAEALQLVSDREHTLEAARREHNLQLEQQRNAHSQESAELQEQLDHQQSRLREKDEVARRLQRDVVELQSRAESTEADLRRTQLVHLQEARRRAMTLELEVADAKQASRTREEEMTAQLERFESDRDAALSEVSRLRREKDVLAAKLREQDATADFLRKKNLNVQQESVAKIASLEKAVRDLRAAVNAAEVKADAANLRLQELERERLRLKEHGSGLEQRLVDETRLREVQQKEFRQQLESLGPAYRERAEELHRQLKSAIGKERKRADAYKAKALQAHDRAKSLSELALQTNS